MRHSFARGPLIPKEADGHAGDEEEEENENTFGGSLGVEVENAGGGHADGHWDGEAPVDGGSLRFVPMEER